jgi:two-component system chemotaxis response regulator CheB
MPELFTKVLAEQLRGKTGLQIEEAEHGERLRPGRVYLAPGARHMGVAPATDGPPVIRLDEGPPIHHCRPAVDVLFADLAKVYGSATLGLVLTGMGTDGTDGARAVVRTGGTIFVQDESTSTVWGMPGSIAKAGLASRILPLGEVARAVNDAIGPA